MDSSVFVRLVLLDRVAKLISMIVCRNHAEITAFVMTQLQATHANAHLVTPDSRVRQILMIVSHRRAIVAHALTVIIHSLANAVPATPENFVKLKLMNANQVSRLFLCFHFLRMQQSRC